MIDPEVDPPFTEVQPEPPDPEAVVTILEVAELPPELYDPLHKLLRMFKPKNST